MLNSKRLMEETGISRATLNNYVAQGILPNPVVRSPAGESGRATRLGYFDESAVDTVNQVQQLKKQGLSMAQIADLIGTASTNAQQNALTTQKVQNSGTANAAGTSHAASSLSATPVAPPDTVSPANHSAPRNLNLEASIDNLPGPGGRIQTALESKAIGTFPSMWCSNRYS